MFEPLESRTLFAAAAIVDVAPVTATRWAPGRTGAGVTFYRITGMGHRWPVTTEAADHTGDQLAGVSAAAIIARTASTASREGRTTVMT